MKIHLPRGAAVLLAALAVVVAAAAVGTEDSGGLFVRANDAYEAGRWSEAIELYRALLDEGIDSGALHYNLGNAYLRHGELGRAIASYRRGLAQRPRDEDARANLEFARRSARDAIAPPAPSAVQTTLLFWHYRLSRGELAVAALLLNLLFWSVAALRLFRPSSETLRWGALLLLVPLLAVSGSLLAHHFLPQRIAVVVPQEIEARSGPGADTVLRFKLHAGTEVRIRERRDGWLRIVLPDGQQGWIEDRHAEVLSV